MAILGTFSSFTAARLGIYASQAQLQVTGNNIANINTRGYTRQRGDLFSLNATGLAKYATGLGPNVGYGVLMDSVSQIRDPFLDIRFRNQNTKTAEAEATLAGLQKIAQTLDEVNKGGVDGKGVIENCLQEMLTMLRLLSDDVGSEEYDSLVREAAKSLTAFFNTAADKLERDWNLQVDELKDTVKSVNKCLTNIRDLNEQIRKQGIYGDNALELRDHRNLYIDELSSYLGIDVEYSMERIDQYTEVEKLTIYLKDTQDPRGTPGQRIKLVDGLYAAQLSFSEKEINPNYNAAEAGTPAINYTAVDADGNLYKYLDEDGKGTNDITKAAMVKANPEYAKSVPLKNRDYDPKYKPDPEDPDYNPNDPRGFKYVKANGVLTNDASEAVRVAKNPDYDPEDPNSAEFLDGNGNEIDFDDLPSSIVPVKKYLDDEDKPTDDPTQAAAASRKYLDKNGNETNDPDKAADVEVDPDNPKKFLLQVERLEDKFGYPMNQGKNGDVKESVAIPLNDTELQGAIQAMRELLTEEGEFASLTDVGIKEPMSYSEERAADAKASLKKGIPYYMRRLDLLAQQFAKIFNENNQLDPSLVYETHMVSEADVYSTNDDGQFVSKNGPNDIIYVNSDTGAPADKDDPDAVPLTKEMVENAKNDPDQTMYEAYMEALKANGVENDEPGADLLGETVFVDKDGNYIKKDDDSYLTVDDVTEVNSDGVRVPVNTTEAAKYLEILRNQGVLTKEYDYYDGGVLFSNSGDNNDPTNITAKTISISRDWSARLVRVLNSTEPNDMDEKGNPMSRSSANDNIMHLIAMFEKQLDYKASDLVGFEDAAGGNLPFFHGSFQEMYTDLGATLGMEQNTMDGIAYNYEVMTLDLDNDRISVYGVDLNDEATSMMQFQKSYQAACKLLTTLDAMLDTLINGTLR